MDREMPKGLVVALLVGAMVLGVGLGIIVWQTRTDKLLQAPALESTSLVESGSQVLGSILNEQPTTSIVTAAARREADLKAVAAGLTKAYLLSGAVTLALLTSWTAYAWLLRPRVAGVRASSIAATAWYIVLLAALAGLSWQMYATIVSTSGAAALLIGPAKAGVVGMSALLTLLAFYFGTSLGCPPELRASVPFANAIIPLGRSRA